MKNFILYWRDGKYEIITGKNIHSAFDNAGYGPGALAALYFYTEGDVLNCSFNKETRDWERKPVSAIEQKE